jgi:hypothetical protein
MAMQRMASVGEKELRAKRDVLEEKQQGALAMANQAAQLAASLGADVDGDSDSDDEVGIESITAISFLVFRS